MTDWITKVAKYVLWTIFLAGIVVGWFLNSII